MFSVSRNVRGFDRSRAFYARLGMEEESGYRCVSPKDLDANTPGDVVAAVRRSGLFSFPWEPNMHIELVEWESAVEPNWPPTYDQLGSTKLALEVSDLEAEVARLTAGGHTPLRDLTTVDRLWGPTRSVLYADPDGNFVELLQIDFRHPTWENKGRSVAQAPKAFMHFQINTEQFAEMIEFYEAFGFESDTGLVTGRTGPDGPVKKEELGGDPQRWYTRYDMGPIQKGQFEFLRLPTDQSHMHLEIMSWDPGTLKDPLTPSVWNQKGIARTCFKTSEIDQDLELLRRCGTPIYATNQRSANNVGDSVFFNCGDPDENILCLEQWYHARHWGSRW
jgi:catechol 2,3-dioxygenase-like lactoylglutathione lyase family enzyme